jgi:hypothetical protein
VTKSSTREAFGGTSYPNHRRAVKQRRETKKNLQQRLWPAKPKIFAIWPYQKGLKKSD